MTACTEYETLLHGLVDGELDAANTFACEKHLASCSECAAALQAIEQLRRKLRATPLSYAASEQLRKRINVTVDAEQRTTVQTSSRKTFFDSVKQRVWPAVALAMMAALVLIVLLPPAPDDLVNQIIAGHVRSLQVNHLVDVETSDRHVVKPWFAGKIDFSPPVIDLADKGFDLIGGRLDYLQSHTVAALAYRRRAHTINLFIWPATGNAALISKSSNGFNLVHWQSAGMTYWAVSDLNLIELRQFQASLAAQVPM